jgi:hypothetical protein
MSSACRHGKSRRANRSPAFLTTNSAAGGSPAPRARPRRVRVARDQMSDAPSYSEAADGLHSEKSAPVEPAEESKRLQSSVAQFTSKSIKELEGLTFELHGLEEFLKSETERVQGDINNALAGLRVIIDTISPWRNVRPDPVQGKPSSTPEPRMQRSTLASGQR